MVAVAKAMKRTEAAVRQKAKTIGIGLGHRREDACFLDSSVATEREV